METWGPLLKNSELQDGRVEHYAKCRVLQVWRLVGQHRSPSYEAGSASSSDISSDLICFYVLALAAHILKLEDLICFLKPCLVPKTNNRKSQNEVLPMS